MSTMQQNMVRASLIQEHNDIMKSRCYQMYDRNIIVLSDIWQNNNTKSYANNVACFMNKM